MSHIFDNTKTQRNPCEDRKDSEASFNGQRRWDNGSACSGVRVKAVDKTMFEFHGNGTLQISAPCDFTWHGGDALRTFAYDRNAHSIGTGGRNTTA